MIEPLYEGAFSATLTSGLKVLTEEIPSSRCVSVGIWVKAGSRDDPPSQAGLAHFLEHLLFKGTKTRDAARIAREIAEDGYVVFNVDYRLIQDGGYYPKCIKDVKCAVRWLRANAEKLNVDPARIGALGGSAGGYLAAFLAATSNMDEFQPDCDYGGDPSTRVHAAAIFFGLTDLRIHPDEKFPFNPMLARFFNDKNAAEKPELLASASVITYAAKSAPVILLHGEDDKLVDVS